MNEEIKLKKVDIKIDDKSMINTFIKFINDNQNIVLVPQLVIKLIQKQIQENKRLNNLKHIQSVIELYLMLISNDNNHSKKLYKINYNYKYYCELWMDNNIFKKRTGYSVGEESFNYIANGNIKLYSLISFGEYKDNNKKLNIDDYASNLISDTYKDVLLNADIDAGNAILDEYNNSSNISILIKRINKIFNFKYGNRYIKRGEKVNRLYSSFSDLTSISRKYVTYNNNNFYEVDMDNAQPTILANLLIKNNYKVDKHYINDVTNGNFYEKISLAANRFNINFQYSYSKNKGHNIKRYFNDRDDVKKLCYQNIFFDQKINSEIFKLMKTTYYQTTKSLLQFIHANKDTTLASQLQNLEADIFTTIDPGCPYFTVHDAIYITYINKLNYVKEEINKKMGKNNYRLSKGKSEEEIKNDTDNKRYNYEVSFHKQYNTDIIIIEAKDTVRKSIKNKKHKERDDKLNNRNNVEYLLSKGYKQKEIAEQLGISVKTVQRHKKQINKKIKKQ